MRVERASLAWSARWLDGIRPTLKPKTVAGYESLLRSRVLPALGRTPLAALRPSDVQSWIGSMEADGLSASRIREANIVLSQLLDAAVRDGRIARNAARGVKLPRIERREAAYLEPAVVDDIISAMPDRYSLMVAILGTLGPRFGEAVALRRRSVDLLRRRLVISESLAEVGGVLTFGTTKTHAHRAVPLPPSIAADLADLLETLPANPDALLFTTDAGTPVRHANYTARILRPTLERLGLPQVGIHVLRHSAAARMIAAGASPKAVQTILGHGSAAFTLTAYGHLFDADLDDLAGRLDVTTPRQARDQRGTSAGPLRSLPMPNTL